MVSYRRKYTHISLGKIMLISLCIPCMNRAHDLKSVMQGFIDAANASPPTEIAILNYNSTDDLDDYIKGLINSSALENGNIFTYTKTNNKEYFHMANARNCSMLSARGDVLCMLSADTIISNDFVKKIRPVFESEKDSLYMCEREVGCIILLKKEEFIKSGGYDERFEFYGPEDKDMCLRLKRRGLKFKPIPPGCLVGAIPTSNDDKMRNYRIYKNYTSSGYAKGAISKKLAKIYMENIYNNVLVANVGIEWGSMC